MMHPDLQKLYEQLISNKNLTDKERSELVKQIKSADKQIDTAEFKLQRTEKIKKTTAIMLEETIAELEKKRKEVEERVRESEIQVALERVRTRAMAMQNSLELGDVAVLIYSELIELGFDSDMNCGYIEIHKEGKVQVGWLTKMGEDFVESFSMPLVGDPVFDKRYAAWKKKTSLTHQVVSGKELEQHKKYATSIMQSSEWVKNSIQLPDPTHFYNGNFSHGYLQIIGTTALSQEQELVFSRFTKVFEQTYTRFLDLKKAEAQAREAQIEASLERVRSRALAMHSSDELNDLIITVFKELRTLDLVLTRCLLWIFNPTDNSAIVWMTNSEDPNQADNYHVSNHKHPTYKDYLKAWKNQERNWVYDLKGKNKDKWDDILVRGYFKSLPSKVKKAMIDPERVFLSGSFNKYGVIQTASLDILSEHQQDILRRFSQVFEQNYTRFLDLQKAETQARDAQIEAALERIRSKTNAMQESSQLAEVTEIVFQEAIKLNFGAKACDLIIIDKTTGGSEFWISGELDSEDVIDFKHPGLKIKHDSANVIHFKVPKLRNKHYQDALDSWEKRKKIRSTYLKGRSCQAYMRQMTEKMYDSNMSPKVAAFLRGLPAVQHTEAYMRYGYFRVASIQPLHEHEENVLMRFAKVFEQTYTRFLDLRKAEAQAREAQIEAGLERVRAQSMAMHKSEELQNVVNSVFEQMKILGMSMNVTSIFVFSEGVKDWEQWVANPDTDYSEHFQVPFADLPVFHFLENARTKGKDFIKKRFSFKEKNEWFNYAFENTEYRKIPKKRKKYILESEFFEVSFGLAAHIGIQIAKYEGAEFSEEENSILKRFTSVFEQAFTRFLDLQKAEAQAREAQIEAALEKVRSRTIAMQSSAELPQAANDLFLQVQALGIPAWSAGYCIWEYSDRKSASCNMSSEGELQKSFSLPTIGEGYNFYEPTVRGESFYMKELGGKALVKHYEFMQKLPGVGVILDELKNAGLDLPTYQIFHIVYFSYGYLMFITYEPVADSHEIFQRFGVVFEQTYTRFLDLKKAEAQTREAQIEAALERVRAVSMAMHESNELVKVATIVYQQLIGLGFDSVISGGFNFPDEKNNVTKCWFAETVNEGLLQDFTIPLTGDPVLDERQKYRKKGIKFLEQVLKRDEVKRHMEFVFPQGGSSDEEHAAREAMPNPTIFSIRFLNEGYMILISVSPLNEEQKSILERFASVFNLAYTRFLDLQKAEAQAQEAKIEAALERVRARTMAMHQSSELPEVVATLYKQLLEVGINSWMCVLALKNDKTDGLDLYLSNQMDAILPRKYEVPPLDHRVWREFNSGWKEKVKFKVIEYGGKEKIEYDDLLLSLDTFSDFTKEQKAMMKSTETTYASVYYMPHGMIQAIGTERLPDEKNEILIRFAKAFEQTYTRFQDLKKAEAQAREAEIEAALERVRSGTMAMHQSEQLRNVIDIVFDQLEQLEIKMDGALIQILEDSMDFDLWVANPEDTYPDRVNLPYLDHPAFNNFWNAAESGVDLLTDNFDKKEKDYLFRNFFKQSDLKYAPEHRKKFLMDSKGWVRSVAFGNNTALMINRFDLIPFEKEENEIFKRFSAVFDQAYTRFLDLKKAEAQAKEAQIEASLEKVRGMAMAMHSTKDLTKTASIAFAELSKLGINPMRSGISIQSKENRKNLVYTAARDKKGSVHMVEGWAILDNHPILSEIYEYWLRGDDYFPYMEGEVLKAYYKQIANKTVLPKEQAENEHYGYFISFTHGMFYGWSESPISQEDRNILKRFTSVIDLTFKRYYDLQKAEAQARESQIEAALERVRAASMAMHKTDELSNVVMVLFQQFTELEIEFYQLWINIFFKEDKFSNCWFSPVEGVIDEVYTARVPLEPFEDISIKSWRAGEEFSYLSWKGKAEVNRIMKSLSEMTNHPSFKEIQKIKKMDRIEIVDSNHKYGVLALAKNDDFSDEDLSILRRFTKVFEQAYTRFLDLQKAEAQVRESQIEASLERVRSKAMAMHDSDHLKETINEFFKQLKFLDIVPVRCGVGQVFNDPPSWNATATNSIDQGNTVHLSGFLGNLDHPVLQGIYDSWVNQEDYFPVLKNESLKKYYEILRTSYDLPQFSENEVHYGHYFNFTEGNVYAWTAAPLTDDEKSIFKRFSSVLSMTYRRYLDLQKSEAQAREAQIEASLERVRFQAMAMRSSEEVEKATSVVFSELENLGVEMVRFGVFILKKGDKYMHTWGSKKTSDSEFKHARGLLDISSHALLKNVYDSWIKGNSYFRYDLVGKEVSSYYNTIAKSDYPLPDMDKDIPKRETCNVFYFPEGGLFAFTPEPFPESDVEVFKRFAGVFTITYRRYLDLQKAEAQAREAVKQSSLDRIRAEIASMRTTKDLERITPLIWKELTTLGVPFFRCGVFIMDSKRKMVHSFLSTPTGESLASFHLKFDFDLDFVQNAVHHWKEQKIYKDEWDRQQFIESTQKLLEAGQVENVNTYQHGEEPPEHLVLQMVPFKQGMLYAGSEKALTEDQLQLVEAVTRTFAVAYARYEDFNQLESAKKKIEKTLSELKSAQDQLVHSEKMASLGELTAGIAHEIQNPLNFVNNFSDVNKELAEELLEALGSGDLEEAKDLAADIISNEEKIIHHGHRADGIVKGMLQHSRGSNNEKELTDINELADEYLRLAYHGLRAKDKSFNADFKIEVDETIPEIKVVPQDIGRVLLNLINNAFQATSQKLKADNGYKPIVWVTTRLKGKNIEISVKDNGPGIPDEIKDKIFEPFYTTKSAGQGTGLGLSMSYDIVAQGHGGEIKVKSKEGEGSEFLIILPV